MRILPWATFHNNPAISIRYSERGRPGGLEHAPLIQEVTAANRAFCGIENIGKNQSLVNPSPDTPAPPEKENPGALAGATGDSVTGMVIQSAEYRLRAERATTLALAIADCHPDDAVPILSAALDDLRPGQPVTAFLSQMDEAGTWAAFATRQECKAYALAAFNAMRPADQAAFLAHVQGRAAA